MVAYVLFQVVQRKVHYQLRTNWLLLLRRVVSLTSCCGIEMGERRSRCVRS
jgi:hypothetical protein